MDLANLDPSKLSTNEKNTKQFSYLTRFDDITDCKANTSCLLTDYTGKLAQWGLTYSEGNWIGSDPFLRFDYL